MPEKVSKVKSKAIKLESKDYELIANQLYKRGKDNQLWLCVTEFEYVKVLEQAHAGLSGGHFSADMTAKAIMMAGLWWPTLFSDAIEFVKRCDECERVKVTICKDNMPLQPMMGARACAKWGIEFVGPINCKCIEQGHNT